MNRHTYSAALLAFWVLVLFGFVLALLTLH